MSGNAVMSGSADVRRLVILGAGGTGRDVVDFVDAINAATDGPGWECVGFLDDDPEKAGATVAGLEVRGPLDNATGLPDVSFVDALGSPRSFRERPSTIDLLDLPEERFATLIHPTAVVSPSAEIGPGCVLYPFTMIGAAASLGGHVIVLSHSVVNHHGRVGDFSILASGCTVSGKVTVGRCCYLGAGSTTRDGVTIGEGALVGAGSVVVEDVAGGSVVAGVPARPLNDPAGRSEPPGGSG